MSFTVVVYDVNIYIYIYILIMSHNGMAFVKFWWLADELGRAPLTFAIILCIILSLHPYELSDSSYVAHYRFHLLFLCLSSVLPVCCSFYPVRILGETIFRHILKISKSDYRLCRVYPSLSPSAWNNSVSNRTGFHEISYLKIFRASVENIEVSLKSEKELGTL